MALAFSLGCVQVRGCGDGGRHPIVDVQIVGTRDDISPQREPQQGPRVTDEALKPTLRRMMEAWPDFAFRQASPGEVGWQLTVRIEQLTERTADPTSPSVKARSAGVSVELRALDEVAGEQRRYRADRLLTRREPASVPIAELVQDALQSAGARLMRYRTLGRAEPEVVIEALSDPEEAVRLVAVQTAGNKKMRAAIPALVELLKKEDEAGAVIVSAVGALTAMQATEATGAIIDTARRQDRDYIVPLLYALAQLGGRQAQAYLFTVQSGHPDPVVKAAAAEALEELERRLDTP